MSSSISRRSFLAAAALTPAAALLGCGGGSSSTNNNNSATKNVVRSMTALTHSGVIATKPYPPAVARAHAMVATSMFDAWAAYDSVAVGTRLLGTLRRPVAERTDANKQKAVAFAGYRALVDLFPAQKAIFDAQMTTLGFDPTDTSTDTTTPSGIGNTVANALLTFRHTDGSNQLGDLHPGAYTDYTGYTPKNAPDTNNPATNVVADPDHWQPLTVSNGAGGFVVQKYQSTIAGLVKPFALTSGSQFRSTAVISKFGSAEYLAKCQVVIDASANLTPTQKLLTEYWADGPGSVQPPGHWMVFSDTLSVRDNHTLDQDVKLFFLVANAVFDAGIACWDTKTVYDSVRPLTAIHVAFKGQTIRAWGGPGLGTISMPGQNFGTYQSVTFVTPAFPSYLSGHSSFSASAAEVMKRFTGSDNFGTTLTFAPGSSVLEPGLVPTTTVNVPFATFTDAANSAAASRVTGGIHFVEDNTDGLAMGRQVGAVVFDKVQTYINGTATTTA
jgi:hypothetical protein